MQWSAILLLCDRYDRQAELDIGLEEAMRDAMTRPMGFDGWRAVFESLLGGTRVHALLGVEGQRELPVEHPVADAIFAASGEFDLPVDLTNFVRAVADPDNFRDDAAPAILAGITALIEASPAIRAFRLVYIEAIEGAPDGRFTIRHRVIQGTAWPTPQTTSRPSPPPFRAGQLLFWDGADRRVAVPEWLLRFDAHTCELRVYDGRDPVSRAWRFVTARPGGTTSEVLRLGTEAPVVLAEPTWRTPAPASRRATPQPATLSAPRAAVAPTATPAADKTLPIDDGHGPARYLLTVLGGRSFLSCCQLSDDDSVVMGRNPAFATFVIHNGEVSRSNTRVWTTASGDLYVQDLRSTNGSSLNEQPVGSDPERVQVGDVIGVGPVPVGVSWWSEEEASRLRRLVARPEDRDRDLLTGLYTPAWLSDGGAESLRAGFVSDPPVGLLLVVDRLGALHAQHGAEVADTVFQNVARALLSRLAAPGAGVRIGYGEIFALLPEGGAQAALALGQEMLEWIADHRWDPKGIEVTLTGSVTAGTDEGSVDDWIARARKRCSEGRTNSGRAKIYTGRS